MEPLEQGLNDSEKTTLIRIKKLANLLDRFMTGVKKEIEKKTTDVKISGIQGRIILFLHSNAGREVRQKEVAQFFDVRDSTAAIVLRRMEKNGLILRHTSSTDERAKAVTLTQKARKMHALAHAEIEVAERRITAGLSEKEVELFNKILDKIAANIG